MILLNCHVVEILRPTRGRTTDFADSQISQPCVLTRIRFQMRCGNCSRCIAHGDRCFGDHDDLFSELAERAESDRKV